MSKLETRISCLCVTYNRPEFHRFLKWNFHKQSWPSRELVVVDGSDCSYREVFQHPQINYIHLRGEPNIPLKRNVALDNACGDVVTWFDDDDWQHPNKLSWLVDSLADGAPYAGANQGWFVDLMSGMCRPSS